MKINTDSNCNIIIYDDTEYPIGCLTYEDSVSIYLVQLNTSDGGRIIYSEVNNHTDTSGKVIQIPQPEDGYITVCHLILPTVRRDGSACGCCDEFVRSKDFIRYEQIDVILGLTPEESVSLGGKPVSQSFLTYDKDAPLYYFYSDGKYYREDRGEEPVEVSLNELLSVNPTQVNFVKQIQNFFAVCWLRKCYVNLSQQILNGRGFNNCFDINIDSSLIFKRDLVWSTLNVIQYMIDNNQLAEAERLIERISGCAGLCTSRETGERGCGCSK